MSEPLDWNAKTIAEFRANEGRVGGNFEGAPMVLVHHRGRKSGREHVTPVMYLPHDTEPDIIYVFATKAGAPTHRGKGALEVSGGDQEGVALKAPEPGLPAGVHRLKRRYWVEVASEPGRSQVPGMSLAVARIAGQVVPGVEVARAWSAASARNGGGPARTWPPPEGAARGMPASAGCARGGNRRRAGSRTGS